MSDGPRTWPAPAKLNLFLQVTGRRPDGYHELQTVYQLLDWGDELAFEVRDDALVTRRIDLPGIPEEEDLCVRAARLLQSHARCTLGASIELVKRIPSGAGLGGGSSDAATTLHALNRLWGCGCSTAELAELGLRLGADVPVFVRGHSAWAEGIGELLQPLKLGACWYVLVFPGVEIPTRQVFAHPDLVRKAPRTAPADFDPATAVNSLQETVLEMYPELDRVFGDLAAWGRPRLTGTGSCVFMRFMQKVKADRATKALKCRYNVLAVRGVDRSPLLALLPGNC